MIQSAYKSDVELCKELECSQDVLEEQLHRVNELLLSARSHRIRPGLDNKCLTGWNAMTVRGLCEAYAVLGEVEDDWRGIFAEKEKAPSL